MQAPKPSSPPLSRVNIGTQETWTTTLTSTITSTRTVRRARIICLALTDVRLVVGYRPSQFSWFTPDPAASTYDEELDREQQPQLTPNQHLVQPFDPPMDLFPVEYFSTLTPVPKDVAPDPGLPSVNRTSSAPVAARG